MIRAVVVEDEPLARRYLVSLLAGTGRVEVVGQAGDGWAGLQLCRDLAPDAAFVDIRIPGPDGLSLAGRLMALPRPPMVVFVTSYAGHAVDAFRVEAVDYLLKPLEAERVREAVSRLEHRLAQARGREPEGAAAPSGDRLPIRRAGDDVVRLLPRGEIMAAVRRSRRTWVHAADEEFATYYPVAALARWLGGPPFLRVARDAIVNMEAVAEVVRLGDRQYRLRLADRARTVVEVSRSGAAALHAYLQGPERRGD